MHHGADFRQPQRVAGHRLDFHENAAVAIDYTALKTYLQTDPDGLGFASYLTAGNDSAVAGLLNTAQVSIQVANLVPWATVTAAIDAGELPSITDATLQSLSLRFQLIGARDVYDLTNAALWAIIQTYFGGGSTPKTYANLQGLQHRNGSHAEKLFGVGTVITGRDIEIALGRGQ